MQAYASHQWPDGKRFAFSVFDDTDRSTVENTKPVYDLLFDLGFLTTKSVWPISIGINPPIPGMTCDDLEYRNFVIGLQKRGFEIGYHLASYNPAKRPDVERAFLKFLQLFGHYPISMANHHSNEDGMYWGDARFSGVNKIAYNLLSRFKQRNWFRGHVETDQYFWAISVAITSNM
jgi:hypothetical protein